MRRLLVTGGAGFIGSNFVRHWLGRDDETRLVNLDRLTYAGNLENLAGLEQRDDYDFVRADICDADALARVMEAEAIDTVVHFAAESHVDRSISGPSEFVRTNVNGTFALLDAARQAWAGDDHTRFVHVSTDEVYGTLGPDDAPFSETTAYAPNSPYAASKAASDHLARAWHHTYGLPVITTNCSNNYGPWQFPEKLIPLVIINCLEGLPLPIYGDGRQVRDWLHVEDHCRAIATAIEAGTPGEVYNIGSDNEQANIDIVHKLCDLVDELVPEARSRRELITYVTDRPGHDRRYAVDARHIHGSLGWAPLRSFDDGLRDTVRWYLSHREWWERVRDKSYLDYYERQYGTGGASE